MLTREQINAANVVKPVAVEVPEWGGEVFVKRLSPSAVLALSAPLNDPNKSRDELMALQLSVFLCDESGTLLYTAEQALAELVQTGLSGPTTRVLQAALRENGMGGVEAVKGNS